MHDVLGTDCLLAEAALEGTAQSRITVRLQERVESLDVVNPDLRAPMRELGEIRQGCRAEIQQVLTLQVASGPCPGDRRDPLRTVLGQDRAVAGGEFPLVLGTEAASNDPHALAV